MREDKNPLSTDYKTTDHETAADRGPLGAGIGRATVLLLATTCGAAAASLYYAQPLLHTIAGAFSVSEGTAGLLVTITQGGYVIGLALLVPVGDLLERRRLIAALLVLTAAGPGAGRGRAHVRLVCRRAGRGRRQRRGGPDRGADVLLTCRGA